MVRLADGPVPFELLEHLCRRSATHGAYTDVKDPVLDVVVAAAQPWAAATGCKP